MINQVIVSRSERAIRGEFVPCGADPDGSAPIDPLVKTPGRFVSDEGDPDAAVRGGVVRDAGEAVYENVSVDLNTPRHEGIVIAGGVVYARLKWACLKITCGCAAIAARTDSGPQDKPGTLPRLQFLIAQTDLHAFGRNGESKAAETGAHGDAG